MIRGRVPLGVVVAATSLATLFVPEIPAALAAQADSTLDLTPLQGKKSVIVGTKDGRWIEGKPIETSTDTLIVRRRFEDVRVPTADIAGVWQDHPAVVHTGLVHGVGGFVGGALLEIGLGSDCPGCAINAGDVLASGVASGVADFAVGALLGLFGGRRERLAPPPVPGERAEPYPAWGGSALVGYADNLRPESDSQGFVFRTVSWSNDKPKGSWGIEYGTLAGPSDEERHYVLVYPDSVFPPVFPVAAGTSDVHFRERWGYATFQYRWRFGGGATRPEFTFGFGSYLERTASTSVRRDTLGVIVSERHGQGTSAVFGLNVGTGVSFGHGDVRPALDARFHWAISPAQSWVTLGARADWH